MPRKIALRGLERFVIKLDNNQKGRWSETRAMSYLLENEYEVFVGFGNTSCDLIIQKDGQIFRVEVKSASPSRSPGVWVVAGVDKSKFDMLLVVKPNGEVLENPDVSDVYQGK